MKNLILFIKPKLNSIVKPCLNFLFCVLIISITFSYAFSSNNTAKAISKSSTITSGKKLSSFFPDENFEKYVYKCVLKKTNWKANKGSYILTDSDVSLITNHTTELTFYTTSQKDMVKDYTGIQNFKKLSQLFIQINGPTDLDLSNMKHLNNVIIYGFNSHNCKDGFAFTNDISEEDIINAMRNLPGLFFCYGNNQNNILNSLNLTGCKSIKNLSILSYNKLTSFDYNLPNLSSLKILGSFIDQLNLGAYPHLNDLVCLGTPIERISGVSLSLQSVILEQTSLLNIDFSNYTNLTKFVCVNNPDLKNINLSGCIKLNRQISNMKNLPSLERLYYNTDSNICSTQNCNHSSNIYDFDSDSFS